MPSIGDRYAVRAHLQAKSDAHPMKPNWGRCSIKPSYDNVAAEDSVPMTTNLERLNWPPVDVCLLIPQPQDGKPANSGLEN